MLTAGVGLLAATLIGLAMRDQQHYAALATVQFGSALLVAVGFLALTEVVFPRGTWAGVARWPKSLRRRASRSRRYAQLSRIAVRHGLGKFLRGRVRRGPTAQEERARLAPSLREALEDAGVTFVKMGQVLSTRYDLLPPEFIAELSKLQHQATPDPWDDVRRLLREELGTDPFELFAEFDQEPLAAGSIAQVHRARLRDGTQVVVKVQRPSSQSVVDDDLDILLRFDNKVPWGVRPRPRWFCGRVRRRCWSSAPDPAPQTPAGLEGGGAGRCRGWKAVGLRPGPGRAGRAGRYPLAGPGRGLRGRPQVRGGGPGFLLRRSASGGPGPVRGGRPWR
ncbi:AarF/UbiB family protein [Streptomyces sp. NPDC056544]|uniref:AarF/UbiB family protein n=1 Tax=unclassified Streptomyces TaxID=2593676 RepID=UPI0036B2BEB6